MTGIEFYETPGTYTQISDKKFSYNIYNDLINTSYIQETGNIWKENTATVSGSSCFISPEHDTTESNILWSNKSANWNKNWNASAHIRWMTYDNDWVAPVVPPGERLRQMIQARMSPAFHRRRTHLSVAMDIREKRARQTLRRIIGDQAFKKFLRDGFMTVVPKSGLTYRIFPGHGVTEVFDRGIMVDRLCVVLQGDFPPTDSLLMRYLLILNDEGEFSEYAVKHHVSQNRTKLIFPDTEEIESLTKTWAKLKVA